MDTDAALVLGYLIRNVLWKMVTYLSSEKRNLIGLLEGLAVRLKNVFLIVLTE